jgi:predicted nucleotidyltransferase
VKAVKLPYSVDKLPPWDSVIELTETIDINSWLLIGGLMVQAHAMLREHVSRATTDIDMLIDMMSDASNLKSAISSLEAMGFQVQEPALRGTAYHRLIRDKLVVDILVAEHLPTVKRESAKFKRWPAMEVPGGAQAIERRMLVQLDDNHLHKVYIPDLLGALILKSAAFATDKRDRGRHLEDIALLSSFIDDPYAELERLHGSDRKRLRRAAKELNNPNSDVWLRLPIANRKTGQRTIRILGSG